MTLVPGARLGPYEISTQIGEGGMGLVFKAKDSHLGREVALKVLPERFTADPERLARFEREAKLLASLNHPNIAQIYGVEQGPDGSRALVMELVDGPTLAERLAHGSLPIDESLSIARQIAEALEEAHEKGVIHRDLKPQNIKTSIEGKVKVLDFGLAKALDPVSGPVPSAVSNSPTLMNSPTLATALGGTELGVILGTAAYMSPEQAKGKPADRRADIWAFGVVWFEMLSGRQLFAGETASETLAAVLRDEIDWKRLPAATPDSVRRLLRRCLERDPKRRLRDVGEARVLLEELAAGRGEVDSAPPAPRVSSGGPLRWLPWAVAAAALLAAGWLLLARPPGAAGARSARAAHLAVRLPPDLKLDVDVNSGETGLVAVSPDGARIAFVSNDGRGSRLYLRDLASPEARALDGTENASTPFFSPDGRWIGFFGPNRLKKVAVSGGDPIDLCEAGLNRGATWGPDGTIVFVPNTTSGLVRIRADGGQPTQLTTPDSAGAERTHRWPTFLPNGHEVAFTVGVVGRPGDYDDADIDVVDIRTGARRKLVRGASMVRAAGDWLLLGRDGQVRALRLADADGSAPANAISVLRDVAGVPPSGVLHFDVAADGTLVHAERNPRASEFVLAWVDREGRVEPLGLPPREYRQPRLSPDGRRLAVGIGPGRGRESDIWIHDLASGGMSRLTFDGHSESPAWSRDGRSVAYSARGSSAIASRRADGGAGEEILAAFDDELARAPLSFAPDGSLLYYVDGGTETSADLVYLVPGEPEPRRIARSEAVEIGGTLSPDGRHVAYASDETGRIEVYVQAFPGPGGRWQASDGNSEAARWSADGRELFFNNGQRMLAVSVERSGDGISFGRPRQLFELPFLPTSEAFTNYDVAPDGRFLVVRRSSEESMAGHLVVALDWLELVRRQASAR